MTDSTAITCKFCTNKVPLRNMRYNREGSDLICRACYEKSVAKNMNFGKSVKEQRREEKETKVYESGDELCNYICPSCRFKFSRRRNTIMKLRCPYCGKGKVIVDTQSKAQDILDSV